MRPAIRHFLYNLTGQLIPMLVALIALPLLMRHAGTARLGYLGLAWALIGYFALFDLGLSRVVTRRVALAVVAGTLPQEARLLRQLCLRLFLAVALIAMALALLIPARWIVGREASPALLDEALLALPILWATLPATVVTGLLRGSLEGLKRFGDANFLRASFGVWSFGAPLAVLPWSHELPALTLTIAVGRYLSLLAHLYLAYKALPIVVAMRPRQGLAHYLVMLREGAWLTVSNMVGPVMVTFDRFAIAALLSLTAAAYYFVPQELALRLLIIPGAIASTIFPMLASTLTEPSPGRLPQQALLATVITSLPACALFSSMAEPGLNIWMGSNFAQASAPIAAVLAIGLYANCCAQIPFAWIQAVGRADVTGKLHLLQLPLYCSLMLLLTWRFGILGAAWAWTLRAVADSLLLFVATKRLFVVGNPRTGQTGYFMGLGALFSIYLFMQLDTGFMRRVGISLILLAILIFSVRTALVLHHSLDEPSQVPN